MPLGTFRSDDEWWGHRSHTAQECQSSSQQCHFHTPDISRADIGVLVFGWVYYGYRSEPQILHWQHAGTQQLD